ncbi:hypothetical protein AVEN_89109-1 [Araneus ventricosus]|uniref:Uncharacterized protein n=1 Tax=Araneus ventricosus TaxID=182803 RepID=A0A4Y2B135_ARAVE|nr:hypothetical protein AVEN_89109-1 [Araneus ventricosus]
MISRPKSSLKKALKAYSLDIWQKDEEKVVKGTLRKKARLMRKARYCSVLAELDEYIQDLCIFSDTYPVLKLSQVANVFEKRTKPWVLKIMACTERK